MNNEQQLAPLPTERTKQIIRLAEEAQTGAAEVKRRMKLSTEAAIKCGELLTAEREAVAKVCGRGSWQAYYESHFANVLPDRTARAWMKLAAIASSAKDHIANSKEGEKADLELLLSNNITRNAALVLEVFPKKMVLRDDENPSITPASSHLRILNYFDQWITEFESKKGLRRLTEEERTQYLFDFKRVIEFVHQLEAL